MYLFANFSGAVGGDGDNDEDKEKEEEAERERLEAIREAEERRKEKHRKMEEEREKMRQEIRDKVSPIDFGVVSNFCHFSMTGESFLCKCIFFLKLVESRVSLRVVSCWFKYQFCNADF